MSGTLRSLSRLVVFGLLSIPALARAQVPASPPDASPPTVPARRPRIGLVLSGGGARGAAHVGVLKVLEELRIPVDAIAGTSMGSIVGGLYASGMSPAELEKALTGVDWNSALTDRTSRDLLSYRRKQDDLNLAMSVRVGLQGWKVTLPLGLIQGQKLELLLRSFVTPVATVSDFDDLVYPFRAVATDLATTNAVVMGEGDLVKAMRASMSVPAVFTPTDYEGRLLIDGGVANNLPVDVVREMGVDVIIAVDIGAQLYAIKDLTSAYSVNDQMLTGLMRRETDKQMATLGPNDIGLVPDLGSFGSADFAKAGQIIPLGEKAARAATERLRRYSLSEADWAIYRAGLKRFSPAIPTIAKVTIAQNSALSDSYIAGVLSVEPGQKLDLKALDNDLQRIYGLDLFEKVSYGLTPAGPGEVDLLVDARKRSWGPDYMQFGLALSDDLQNNATFDLNFRLNRLATSPVGAEWRTDLRVGEHQLLKTEYYHPFGQARSFFWAPRVAYRQQPFVLLTSSGGESDIFRFTAVQAAVDVGRAFGNWGELRLGIEGGRGKLRPVASNDLGSFDYDEGRVYLQLGSDTYDQVGFPRHGARSFSELSYSSTDLGATTTLGRAYFKGSRSLTWGRHTFDFGLEAGGFFDDDANAVPYTLGGFGRLSGLGESRLAGRYMALLRTSYFHQVFKIGVATIDMPIYVGGSLEYGDVWLHQDDIALGDMLLHGALFLGIDSPLGPIYFGGGWGQNNERALYFALGRAF